RALLERGLVVRHTRNFPGLDGRYIRVATRTPEENDLLVQALCLSTKSPCPPFRRRRVYPGRPEASPAPSSSW
ncbi:MAG: hypothetical protein LBQ90_12125, partial [Synergistaceae bacterium]|nr:hypothetical protein [Synergistaceae bacterium]